MKNLQIQIDPVIKASVIIVLSGILLAFSLAASAQTAKQSTVHIGFVYPVSSNGKEAKDFTNTFSFHVLGGISKSEKVLSFAGLTNIIAEDANGVQVAGLYNQIGGKANGVKFSGLLNRYRSGEGAQVAGLANLAKADVKGVQFAGVVNMANAAEGIQIGGVSNLNKQALKGMQFAGVFNMASAVHGSQVAGVANISQKEVNGIQFAGVLNKAANVKGSQVSGLVNIAKKVKGVQFAGLINIADSSDHPIAIINLIKNGEKSIGLSVDENVTILATFRSGGKVLYGIFGLGYNAQNTKAVYALEAGLGANLLSQNKFKLQVEAVSVSLYDFKHNEQFKTALRILPAYKINQHFEVYAGPSLNYVNTKSDEGKEHTKARIWERTSGNKLQAINIGYTGGLRYIL